jgi:hypothetical protein
MDNIEDRMNRIYDMVLYLKNHMLMKKDLNQLIDKFSKIDEKIGLIESQFVTKEYLDEKFVQFKIDLARDLH